MDREAARQAIRELSERIAAKQADLKQDKEDLEVAVRDAYGLGVHQADLARDAKRHRNTIATWCSR